MIKKIVCDCRHYIYRRKEKKVIGDFLLYNNGGAGIEKFRIIPNI